MVKTKDKMATCHVVNVLCPNGRRQKIKLTAQTTILQIIHDVCKKQNLESKNYSLRHQRKTLNNTLTIRFANLPNNAHLELVETGDTPQTSAKQCVVALQLENGERLVHEFTSDFTLFNILKFWTTKSPSVVFDDDMEGVKCVYTNQQITGLQKLQNTTLSMIGLNGGRGVIRLLQNNRSKNVDDQRSTKDDIESKERSKTSPEPCLIKDKSSNEMDVSSSSNMSILSCSSQSTDDVIVNSNDKPTTCDPRDSESRDTPAANGSTTGDTCDTPIASENLQKQYKKNSYSKIEELMEVEKTTESFPAEKDDMEVDNEPKNMSLPPDQSVPSSSLLLPVEPVQSTSDGQTSLNIRETFSGTGRRLNEENPEDVRKRPRFQSPPSRLVEPSHVVESEIEREAVVFRLGEQDPATSESSDVADDFFEVTVDDLRVMLKHLKNERDFEKSLMTSKMRDNLDRDKIQQYNRVIIRVYFPDRNVLQGFFAPTDTVSNVASFVRENLAEKSKEFYLYTTPPKKVLDKPNITLYEAKLFPTAIVYYGCHEGQGSFLNKKCLDDMTDLGSANDKIQENNRTLSGRLSTSKVMKDDLSNSQEVKTASIDDTAGGNHTTSESSRITRSNNSKTVPKWFKIGK
ncbi:tether containing UBX domain for GLUT4-like [Xenia sp. Carnegie-2017]|uniref:tether containing UBX domain for GLUT4-like n=1 Tax=Xenia sp. Carnegie-2017 TaxID=2897299 RepID=UPI001F0496EC|nr:tether containing UBX domain for GLUT4-like [Xenia sp. Carnegie-2017]